jgi:predicted Ser/Thr protein kinase
MGHLEWIHRASDNSDNHTEILSFSDYMEIFEKNSKNECRPTFEFIRDMLKHYGVNEDGSYKLFHMDHPDCPPVYGQKKVQHALTQNLVNFSEEGFNNKFILLIGPNGSSKSSLVKKLIKGLEDYSETEEGKLFSFSWIFPIENYVKGTLGLNSTIRDTNLVSYAYLEDKEISAIMPSELKDHPLLLIPKEYRQEMIEAALKDDLRQLESVRKSYLYRGDLSKRNRMIYDALLKNYKGKHQEVLKHIRVERFSISKRYSTSAGYDPAAGVSLWQKMGAMSKGAPPQWLSTHPAGPTRIRDIQASLPKVAGLYARADKPAQRFDIAPALQKR